MFDNYVGCRYGFVACLGRWKTLYFSVLMTRIFYFADERSGGRHGLYGAARYARQRQQRDELVER